MSTFEKNRSNSETAAELHSTTTTVGTISRNTQDKLLALVIELGDKVAELSKEQQAVTKELRQQYTRYNNKNANSVEALQTQFDEVTQILLDRDTNKESAVVAEQPDQATTTVDAMSNKVQDKLVALVTELSNKVTDISKDQRAVKKRLKQRRNKGWSSDSDDEDDQSLEADARRYYKGKRLTPKRRKFLRSFLDFVDFYVNCSAEIRTNSATNRFPRVTTGVTNETVDES